MAWPSTSVSREGVYERGCPLPIQLLATVKRNKVCHRRTWCKVCNHHNHHNHQSTDSKQNQLLSRTCSLVKNQHEVVNNHQPGAQVSVTIPKAVVIPTFPEVLHTMARGSMGVRATHGWQAKPNRGLQPSKASGGTSTPLKRRSSSWSFRFETLASRTHPSSTLPDQLAVNSLPLISTSW